jgi:hypothetical protein
MLDAELSHRQDLAVGVSARANHRHGRRRSMNRASIHAQQAKGLFLTKLALAVRPHPTTGGMMSYAFQWCR